MISSVDKGGESVWVIETWLEDDKVWAFPTINKNEVRMVNAFSTKEAAEKALSLCGEHLKRWKYRVTEFTHKGAA